MTSIKNILVLMCFLPLISIAQASKFDSEFQKVSAVFEEQLIPYVEKFVNNQYPLVPQKTQDQLLLEKSATTLYLQKANYLSIQLRKELEKETNVDTKMIYKVLERGYRYEFPGLDYQFFEKVKTALKIN